MVGSVFVVVAVVVFWWDCGGGGCGSDVVIGLVVVLDVVIGLVVVWYHGATMTRICYLCRLLVGAPKAQTTQPHVFRGGAVFKCPLDRLDCEIIPFDVQGMIAII